MSASHSESNIYVLCNLNTIAYDISVSKNYEEREINQPHHTAGEIKKSLIYIGNLSITKYYTKS